MLGCLGGSGVLLGAEHRPGVVLSLLWVVAFDHRQVDAGVVPDPPGCPSRTAQVSASCGAAAQASPSKAAAMMSDRPVLEARLRASPKY
jgi:hypothetical protein